MCLWCNTEHRKSDALLYDKPDAVWQRCNGAHQIDDIAASAPGGECKKLLVPKPWNKAAVSEDSRGKIAAAGCDNQTAAPIDRVGGLSRCH